MGQQIFLVVILLLPILRAAHQTAHVTAGCAPNTQRYEESVKVIPGVWTQH